MDWIQKLARKNPALDYWQKCFRYRKNELFAERVRSFGRDGRTLRLSRLGPMFPDQKIHLAVEDCNTAGLGALLRRTLGNLFYADFYGLTPVTHWTQDVLYADPQRSEKNVFEYYFQPTSHITCEEAMQGMVVSMYCSEQLCLFEELYAPQLETYYAIDGLSKTAHQKLGQIYARHLHLRPELQKKIDEAVQARLQGKKTLGVHVRGTDFKLRYANHPVMVNFERELKEAMNLLEQTGAEQIFLATDDEEGLDLFRNALGEKVVFYPDVSRGRGEKSLMSKSRNLSPYKLGEDALLDLYTLAACDSFIGGLSNVGYMVAILKSAKQEEFGHFVFLNEGINHSGEAPKGQDLR